VPAILHRGRVRWDDQTPVSDALVAVAWGTAPTPEIAIRADSNGQFNVALPAGQFRLEARAPDGAVGRLDLEITNEQREIEIVLRR
jgi:hypothetical protein